MPNQKQKRYRCEALIRTEYSVKITRVVPLDFDRAVLKKTLIEVFGEEADVIEEDFEAYVHDYIHERTVEEKWALYKQAMEKSMPSLEGCYDESNFIDETLSNEMTGLNELTVELAAGWGGNVNVVDVLEEVSNVGIYESGISVGGEVRNPNSGT
jgi:hypothetical protein